MWRSLAMRRAAWMLAATAGMLVGAAAVSKPDGPQGATMAAPSGPDRVLWNFTAPGASVSDWTESSDGTEKEAGKSTGAFKLQKTARFQRAVLFSLLNPEPNGAGFVGFYTRGQWDLSQYTTIKLRARAQGQNYRYKVILRHHGDTAAGGGAYEAYFEMPENQLTTATIPLSSFSFYFRGRLRPNAPALDTTNVTLFGLQMYGGVYMGGKQSGVSSLEIDWIAASQ